MRTKKDVTRRQKCFSAFNFVSVDSFPTQPRTKWSERRPPRDYRKMTDIRRYLTVASSCESFRSANVRAMDGWMDVARASFAVGEPRPFIVSKEHTRSRAVMSRIPTRQKRLFWSGRAVKSIEGLNVMCRDNIVSTSWYIYFFSHKFPWCIRSHAGPEAFSTPTLSLMKTKIEKNTLSFECIAIHRSHATFCLAIFIEIKVVISCSASRSVCLCVYSTTNFEDKQCEQFPIPNHSPSSNYFLLPATNGADHLLVWLDAANTNESYNNADSCLTWPMCIE